MSADRTGFIWHNGLIKEKRDPVLCASDRISRGDGVFDTMLVIDGQPIQYDAHFKRLKRHAAVLDIDLHADLKQAALSLLKKNEHTKGRHILNTLISRGPAPRGLQIPAHSEPQIIMQIAPLGDDLPEIKAVISKTVRRNEGSPLSRIKSVNYGDNILALAEARKQGANEAILLNNAGRVACASIGNIFVMINGVLVTPPLQDGVLDGIARAILLKKHGAKEQSLNADDLHSAQGVYISNSVRGLLPVLSLDGKKLPVAALNINPDFHISS
jgi:branched-chain amino acid aminotransferase